MLNTTFWGVNIFWKEGSNFLCKKLWLFAHLQSWQMLLMFSFFTTEIEGRWTVLHQHQCPTEGCFNCFELLMSRIIGNITLSHYFCLWPVSRTVCFCWTLLVVTPNKSQKQTEAFVQMSVCKSLDLNTKHQNVTEAPSRYGTFI